LISKIPPTLVRITVISGATQKNVVGPKNWACIKSDDGDVLVEATTHPNTMEVWSDIKWSFDSGTEVPGFPNRRRIPRSLSKRYHVVASLGGADDELNLWVLWASVTILTSGTRPANAPPFKELYDGTEILGARSYENGENAVGKVVAVGLITPPKVHTVVRAGWDFQREVIRRDFFNGSPWGGRWDSTWRNDHAKSGDFQAIVPDSDDKIYDRDAPNIEHPGAIHDDQGRWHPGVSSERYDNFRQWVEWNGAKCSDWAKWYWKARWKKDQSPQVTLKEVGLGEISPLPAESGNFYPRVVTKPGD
jgi:hypothetical protein